MTRNPILRGLLVPFSLLYGIVLFLRDGLYKYGLLKSVSFNIPVIGIGNLTLGGAGKTPHVEYLIRLLRPYLNVGILSRGYKRKSKGFRIVGPGDEPLQNFLKFRDITVAVSESRSIGIPLLLSKRPDLQVVMLDDSYQHRSVTPGLNILLTEYNYPFFDDFILPAGRLREWRSGADRADIIIVTKCPDELSSDEMKQFEQSLEKLPGQHLFYSRYRYETPYNLFTGKRAPLHSFDNLIMLSAIANEEYLLSYLDNSGGVVETFIYEDHHLFSAHEISMLHLTLKSLPEGNNTIITTEKDATRLVLHRDFIQRVQMPIHVLPIQVEFLRGFGDRFDALIKRFLLNFKA